MNLSTKEPCSLVSSHGEPAGGKGVLVSTPSTLNSEPSTTILASPSYPSLKRAFDLICAAIGLLVLLPAGLLIALLIKLSDGGSIFYSQTRIGQFGRPFRIWKFRSMVVNADKVGVPLTKEEDPRITRLGRILRKTKLDELPQLWNVLVGEMTFVGPRPEMARYVELYTAEQREILNYKPGITDLATMLFRNEESLLRGTGDVEGFYLRYCLPKKIELNLQYARQAGLLRDLWIIFQTLCPYWLGVLTIYGVALVASLWFSYQLRTDFAMSASDYEQFRRSAPWMVLPQLILLFWRGELRGLMSYFSIPEMLRTATALAVALLFQVVFCYFFEHRFVPMRSILLMDFVLSFFALCGVRMGFRLLRERSSDAKIKSQAQPWRVAIIGTGRTATNLALNFRGGAKAERQVVAFFDDNPRTWNKRPHDIPIVGMPECLLNAEWLEKLDEVIVALPDATVERLQELHEMLKALPLKVTFASGWPVLKPLEA
jgi:lipopolysaccharide/colanic/teichoic acid biosynthesis glycosyltransferase